MVRIVIVTIIVGVLGITTYSVIRFGTDPYLWGWIALLALAASAIVWDRYIRKK